MWIFASQSVRPSFPSFFAIIAADSQTMVSKGHSCSGNARLTPRRSSQSASPAPANDTAASASSSSLWKWVDSIHSPDQLPLTSLTFPRLDREYKNAEGRPYWFHTEDKRSVWEKPDDLKTPREKAIAQTRWKEYKQGEKSYYVHSDTKESTWTVPKELQGEPTRSR